MGSAVMIFYESFFSSVLSKKGIKVTAATKANMPSHTNTVSANHVAQPDANKNIDMGSF